MPILPLIGLMLVAPPISSTDETAVYEDPPQIESEPVVDEPAEPKPEPVTIEAVEPGPRVAVAPEPVAAPRLELPPPPPPPSGAGRIVGGSFAIALGLGAASAVIVEASREGGNPQFAAATFIPLGLTGFGVGTYLLVRGAKARGNFNEWRAFSGRDALPTGDGLIVAGTMSSLIGGVSLVAAAVQTREPGALDRPLAPSLYAIGAAGVGVGVGALTWGLLRRGRYISWRQSTFLGALERVTPTLTPIFDPTPARGFVLRGASFGLSARL